MLLGLPADIANGTNRLSIVSQSFAGAHAYHREGKLELRAIGQVVVPSGFGSLFGALAAAAAPATVLEPVLIGTLVVVAVIMVAKPEPRPKADDAPATLGWRGMLALFAAGIYGGFIQAGVGFVLIAVLSGLLRYDLVRSNALKLTCTSLFGIVALVVFVLAGDVVWLPAVVLAVATVIGAELGVRFAVRVSERVLRWLVLGCVLVSAAVLLLR
jgi:uncharacterized membrane protein YfcA